MMIIKVLDPNYGPATQLVLGFTDDLNEKIEMTVYLYHDSLEPLQNTVENERYILSMESPTKITYLNHYIIHWEKTKTGKDIRRDIKKTIYENKEV